ncbi:hypothetical protein [Kaistella palustris]|uniref:hypothetical protein n=1 Tax=Kaistella palustris TaxID=493376 RepID=UPI00042043DA|nr:hypothetical protein [Kaistella palustris]
MKFIFEIIIATIIIFFLWNILKRLFFTALFKFPTARKDEGTATQKTKKNLDSRINWDAETVDYEEIKDGNETKN